MAEKTYLEAIRDALFEEMSRDPAVFLMGRMSAAISSALPRASSRHSG
jgi:pyruvate/2-oxoglutarate/acetoin dehydrogenase E1 component